MPDFKVRIEELPPMRLAVFRGYSTAPENEAKQLAVSFAEEKGLIQPDNTLKTIGFNKPAPWMTNEDAYGYELWVVISPELDVPPYVMTKNFPGATCTVTSIKNLAEIGPAWEYLYEWVNSNKNYEHAHLDGLEEVTSPLDTAEKDYSFNLYLPVK